MYGPGVRVSPRDPGQDGGRRPPRRVLRKSGRLLERDVNSRQFGLWLFSAFSAGSAVIFCLRDHSRTESPRSELHKSRMCFREIREIRGFRVI